MLETSLYCYDLMSAFLVAKYVNVKVVSTIFCASKVEVCTNCGCVRIVYYCCQRVAFEQCNCCIARFTFRSGNKFQSCYAVVNGRLDSIHNCCACHCCATPSVVVTHLERSNIFDVFANVSFVDVLLCDVSNPRLLCVTSDKYRFDFDVWCFATNNNVHCYCTRAIGVTANTCCLQNVSTVFGAINFGNTTCSSQIFEIGKWCFGHACVTLELGVNFLHCAVELCFFVDVEQIVAKSKQSATNNADN